MLSSFRGKERRKKELFSTLIPHPLRDVSRERGKKPTILAILKGNLFFLLRGGGKERKEKRTMLQRTQFVVALAATNKKKEGGENTWSYKKPVRLFRRRKKRRKGDLGRPLLISMGTKEEKEGPTCFLSPRAKSRDVGLQRRKGKRGEKED